MSKSAKNIAFVNNKSCNVKTTSCLSIAGHLAKSGNKVLAAEFYPPANATSGTGFDIILLRHSIYDILS